ncbi:hypothetical protein OC846_006378 [Tilletia horrida]|uniref:Uncharacterized protein n=1 Tax=Tilletia horrida TaxID=155126 RepID=A0AAN6GIZ1_9BASI|nr:hypothetical protein OC846_006378 [Tilletia horrida]
MRRSHPQLPSSSSNRLATPPPMHTPADTDSARGPFTARNARAATLASNLLDRTRAFIEAHRATCAFCHLHGQSRFHSYQQCPVPAMSFWQHTELRTFARFEEYTACFNCGLPLDYCRELGGEMRRRQGLQATVAPRDGAEFLPCCQNQGRGAASHNPTIFVVLSALLHSPTLFNRARARVQEVLPAVAAQLPAPQRGSDLPRAWLKLSSQRVEQRKTYAAFWLVMAIIDVL